MSLQLADKRETTGNVRARLDFVAGKVLSGRIAHTPPAWAEQLHISEEVVVPCAQAIQICSVDTGPGLQLAKRGRGEQGAAAGRAGIRMTYEPCVETVCDRLPASRAGLAQRASMNGAAPERGKLKKRCMKTRRSAGRAEAQRRARRVEQRIAAIRSAKRTFKIVQADAQGVGEVGEPEGIGRTEVNPLVRIDGWQDRQGHVELCPVQAVEQLKFCEP
ncbi:hypothetical protein, partial [Caballeronia sp. BR00000012568055]|uniref:hypothetical protein n=1 Tax=Caballeronia sp. BR00000012568055 TaxID=2918761 RepID=UPI0023F764B7